MEKQSFDLAAYADASRTGPCFVCRLVARDPAFSHEILYEDDENIAFLNRYPTLYGYTIVAPRRHREHLASDLTESEYVRMQLLVRRVAVALEATVPCERVYVLSLGSQQGNAHLHWHVAPLPPGVPYEQQQYAALMAENGVLAWDAEDAAAIGEQLRVALVRLS
ncbi:HIT family protein [Luteipulveratus sp. YIM 133132]|uniref:HIT family protein n=1 Tax=Luteipulveratus flavus TaxID=3031728 RepID=UPI0023B15401|nr:HIT family protein [Luteipulveratus sp. YIM 133132]MDE9365667.1 HIT family protein [Luteipulveratus sp. YIM 133132]